MRLILFYCNGVKGYYAMSVSIICIHGCLGSRQEFAPLVRKLRRQGYVVHCLPLLGHPGHAANKPFNTITGPTLIADVQHQLQQLGPTPVVLVGHSLGGLVSLGLTAVQKNATNTMPPILGVATLGTPFDTAWTVNKPLGWLTRRSVGHMVKAVRYLPDSMRTVSDPWSGLTSLRNYPALKRETEWLFAWLQQQLPHVKVPAYLCHGHYDLTIPFEARQAIAQQLTQAPWVTLSAITQCGHQIFPKSQAAPAVMDELLCFIDKVTAQQRMLNP
jgi:pimeloyl-ACP methyl ester carboxylesterase